MTPTRSDEDEAEEMVDGGDGIAVEDARRGTAAATTTTAQQTTGRSLKEIGAVANCT